MTGHDKSHASDADAEFESAAKRTFTRSVADTDGGTRASLAAARARALEELNRPPALQATPWWQVWRRSHTAGAHRGRARPLLAIASLAMLAVIAFRILLPPEVTMTPADDDFRSVALTDLEILLGEADLDLLEELEFYTWLDELEELFGQDGSDDGVG